MKRSTLLATGLALSMAGSQALAQDGMQVDFTGSGNIAGSILIPSVGWLPGNVIVDDFWELGQANPPQAYILGQAHQVTFQGSATYGGYLSYQFRIPIALDTSSISGKNFDLTISGTGEFGVYWNPNLSELDLNAGTGFGDLADPGASQVHLIKGEVVIDDGFELTQRDRSAFPQPIDAGSGNQNPNFSDVWTEKLGGGGTLSGEVLVLGNTGDGLGQNADYVVNDMIGTPFTFDMFFDTLGLTTPYTPDPVPSDEVVGVAAFFGDAEDVGGGTMKVVNDYFCFDEDSLPANPTTTSPCDSQYQTSSTTTFNGAFVSEPATIAILGLGMTGFGLASGWTRRRRKTQTA